MNTLLLLQAFNWLFAVIVRSFPYYSGMPSRIWLILLVLVSTVPLAILVKGMASAIYLQDFLIPLIAIFSLGYFRALTQGQKSLFYLLVLLFVVLPLFCTAMLYFFDSTSVQFEKRNFMFLWLAIFRNIQFIVVFYIAMAIPLSFVMFKKVLVMLLLVNVPLAVYGFLHYIFELELTVYKFYSLGGAAEAVRTLGSGFMGLYRGAVGQWYANFAVIALSLMMLSKGFLRLLSLAMLLVSIVLILFSFSRIGALALAAGLGVYLMSSGLRRFMSYLPLVLLMLLGVLLYGAEDIVGRLETISTADDNSSMHRFKIWTLAIEQIGKDIQLFLIGVGFDNQLYIKEHLSAHNLHNDYLSVIYKLGILGVITYFIFLIVYMNYLNNLRKSSQSKESRMMVWAIISVFLSNLLLGLTQDHLFRVVSGYTSGLMMFFLYGLYANRGVLDLNSESQPELKASSEPVFNMVK